MPLRDDRRGRRATIGSGTAPLRPKFKPLGNAPLAPADAMHDLAANEVGAEQAATNDLGANEVATHGVPTNAIDANAIDANAIDANVIDANVSNANLINANAVERGGGVPVDATSLLAASSVETQQRSLLEPGAALMAIARPFLAARSAWLNLLNLSTRNDGGADESIDNAAVESDVLVERSFASEVATLLRAPLVEIAPCDDMIRKSAAAEYLEPPEAHGSPTIAEADVGSAHHPPGPQRPVIHASAGSKSLVVPAIVDTQYSISPELAGSQDSASPELAGSRTRLGEIAAAQQPLAPETADSQKHEAQHDIAVASLRRHRGERVVPLTRLPLRPQGFAITWTADLAEFTSTGTPSRTQRHGLLEGLVREPSRVSSDVVARAYAEEDGEGRAIALRVLLRNFPQAGRAAFIEALRVGSDEERAIAVDGLTAIDAREELTPAFADRVDAVAAKAALAYVGTFSRADYTAALSPYVDEAQIATILKLLAGIVE